MKRLRLPLLAVSTLILSACSVAPATAEPTSAPTEPAAIATQPSSVAADPFAPQALQSSLARADEQGAVIVEVTPLNLGSSPAELEFDVAMNTHSVDLSMDLASLSTLTTDSGVTVQATRWDAPPGGHHVSGKLLFPATQDGKPILQGATSLTLTIRDVDAPARVFEWPLK